MNAQEIFDKVATHLIQQGEPARSLWGYCVYRNERDQKCAVGCLIPDDKYQYDFEEITLGAQPLSHKKADYEELKNVLREELGSLEHFDLLCALQDTHDNYFESVAVLRVRLRYVAEESGLSSDVLDKIDAK